MRSISHEGACINAQILSLECLVRDIRSALIVNGDLDIELALNGITLDAVGQCLGDLLT